MDYLFTLLDLVSVRFSKTAKPFGAFSLRPRLTENAPYTCYYIHTCCESPGMERVESTAIKIVISSKKIIVISSKNVSVRLNFIKKYSTEY